jgi:drug/metabolite transporter superfamily protein YnfA
MPQHVLLTGRTGDTGAHDFIDVLGELGLLHRAQAVGRITHAFGVLLLIASLAWAAFVVWSQFQRRR